MQYPEILHAPVLRVCIGDDSSMTAPDLGYLWKITKFYPILCCVSLCVQNNFILLAVKLRVINIFLCLKYKLAGCKCIQMLIESYVFH